MILQLSQQCMELKPTNTNQLLVVLNEAPWNRVSAKLSNKHKFVAKY